MADIVYFDVACTGTRNGLTDGQRRRISSWLILNLDRCHALRGTEKAVFRHGWCRGADDDMAFLAGGLGYHVIAHPGYSSKDGSSDRGDFAWNHEVMEPEPYLPRNRIMVDRCQFLLAGPKGPDDGYGGTWYTIRYARKVGREHEIFMP